MVPATLKLIGAMLEIFSCISGIIHFGIFEGREKAIQMHDDWHSIIEA